VGDSHVLCGVRQLTGRTPTPRRADLVVFDLDGTLVDSRRDLAEAANLVLEASGARRLSEEAVGRMVGDGAAALIARAFAAAGVAPPADALDRFLAVYDERLLVHTRAYPGIPEVLSELRQRMPLAVLTNKPRGASREILEGLHLSRYFEQDAIIGGDGPYPRKPDPAGLRHLAERAGVELTDTVLVGDSLVDVKTARSAGATICLVKYGFGFETVAREGTATEWEIDAPQDLLSVSGKNTLR
jgi:phosphoglycolate phosphatase